MVPRHVSRPTSTLGRRMRRAARRRLEPVPTARQVRDRRRWNPPRSREGPRTSAIRPAYGCGEDRDTPGFGGWDLTAMVAAGRCKMDESTTPVDQLLRFPLVDALFGRRSRGSARACRSRQDRRRSSREGRRFGRILLVWTVSTKRSARHTARTCGLGGDVRRAQVRCGRRLRHRDGWTLEGGGGGRGDRRALRRRFVDCMVEIARYIHDQHGKFPGTRSTIMLPGFVQAHHIDTDSNDTHYRPGAYLPTHARHAEVGHGD